MEKDIGPVILVFPVQGEPYVKDAPLHMENWPEDGPNEKPLGNVCGRWWAWEIGGPSNPNAEKLGLKEANGDICLFWDASNGWCGTIKVEEIPELLEYVRLDQIEHKRWREAVDRGMPILQAEGLRPCQRSATDYDDGGAWWCFIHQGMTPKGETVCNGVWQRAAQRAGFVSDDEAAAAAAAKPYNEAIERGMPIIKAGLKACRFEDKAAGGYQYQNGFHWCQEHDGGAFDGEVICKEVQNMAAKAGGYNFQPGVLHA